MTKNKNMVEKLNKKNIYSGSSLYGYGVTHFAKRDFKKDEIVMYGFGRIINHQTPHISIQIGLHKHYLPTKWTGKYWNHSCDPNTYIHTNSDGFPNLVALKDIKKDEEITYAYYMSEFSWIENADEKKVRTVCGNSKCKGKILSFSQLSNKEKRKLKQRKLCS